MLQIAADGQPIEAPPQPTSTHSFCLALQRWCNCQSSVTIYVAVPPQHPARPSMSHNSAFHQCMWLQASLCGCGGPTVLILHMILTPRCSNPATVPHATARDWRLLCAALAASVCYSHICF
eukprot:293961-Chlamydomonas_euryale.AAC.4